MINNIKGTKDIGFNETYIWQFVESFIHSYLKKHGYSEVRTPTFENTDLFYRSIGENTDIVSKEMYTWKDQGNNMLTLRPELTASIVRYYIQNKLNKTNPIHRFYYLGPLYRRERPQKGRFRQFHQFGIEVFGSKHPEQDAEVIALSYNFYKLLHIKNIVLKVNSIGSKDSRLNYINSLKKYLEKYKNELSDLSRKRLDTNPLRILDTKIDFEINIIKKAPKIIDYLSNDDKEYFNKTLEFLDAMNISYEIDPYLVRGLDYYSQTVFEIQCNSLGSQNALCGGGRYDYLVEELGGKETPAIGFAAGIERLLLSLDIKKIIPELLIDIYMSTIGESAIKKSFTLLDYLRNTMNLTVINDTLRRTLKSQMKDANKMNAKYVIILGEEELNKNHIIVKNMETGHQDIVNFTDVQNYFK